MLGGRPSAALNDWIELIRVDPGEYGIKDTHEHEWARFIVDDQGVRRLGTFLRSEPVHRRNFPRSHAHLTRRPEPRASREIAAVYDPLLALLTERI